VCLINASAVGTEILKNLVLPGFGSFTIIDGKITDGADAGSNFFLERSSIGLPRGRVATELLKELNEDVNGSFVEEVGLSLTPLSQLGSHPSSFSPPRLAGSQGVD